MASASCRAAPRSPAMAGLSRRFANKCPWRIGPSHDCVSPTWRTPRTGKRVVLQPWCVTMATLGRRGGCQRRFSRHSARNYGGKPAR